MHAHSETWEGDVLVDTVGLSVTPLIRVTDIMRSPDNVARAAALTPSGGTRRLSWEPQMRLH